MTAVVAAFLVVASTTTAIVLNHKNTNTMVAEQQKKLIYDANVFSSTSSTPGAIITTTTAADPGTCYSACQADSECQQWLFDPAAQTCATYRGNPMSDTFYLKNDPDLKWSINQYTPAWQFDGDRDTCGAMCDSNASCQGFIYGDVPYPSCLMYDSSGPSDVITGFR